MVINPITSSLTTYTNSEYIDDEFQILIDLKDQILRDPIIPESEKNIIRQIDFESTQSPEAIQGHLSQLINEHGGSPYAYYYHCIYGATFIETDPDKMIEEMNTSIQLNPNFHFSYFFRGVAHFQKNDFHAAISDMQMAAQLGNTFAQEILNNIFG